MTINVVSYSEIFKLDTCPRQYYYRFGLGLQPLEESGAIVTGVKGHKLLQTFYNLYREGATKEQALDKVQEQARKWMKEEGGLDFHLVSAWTLVDNFIRDIKITADAILVENRFLFPAEMLSDDPALKDYQIGFTPDVVFERKGGFVDVEDSKFVQRAWPQSKINRFQQAKLYQIFLKYMGYTVSRSTLRFFNVKTAEISVRNYILSPAEEATIIHDFIGGVKEVVRFKEKSREEQAQARRTMNYTACQYCAFNFPCGLEAEGKDASKTLQNLFKKSEYDYTR